MVFWKKSLEWNSGRWPNYSSPALTDPLLRILPAKEKHPSKKKVWLPKKPQRSPKEVIISVLKEQPSLSIRGVAAQCGMSIHSVQHHINKLKEAGVIRHVGSTKAGKWQVIEEKQNETGDEIFKGVDEWTASNNP